MNQEREEWNNIIFVYKTHIDIVLEMIKIKEEEERKEMISIREKYNERIQQLLKSLKKESKNESKINKTSLETAVEKNMKKVDYTYINARSDIAIQGDSDEWQNMGYIYQSINQLKKELRKEKDATKTKLIEDIIEIYESRHEELLNQMHLDEESIRDNSTKPGKTKDKRQKTKTSKQKNY